MKNRIKYFLLLSFITLLPYSITHAETIDGVFVTTKTGRVCYKLSEIPTITYTETDGDMIAQLKLHGSDTIVLSLLLNHGETIEVTLGTYVTGEEDNTGVPMTPIITKEKNGRKYISGGKLVIIRDGKQYNINGTLIK